MGLMGGHDTTCDRYQKQRSNPSKTDLQLYLASQAPPVAQHWLECSIERQKFSIRYNAALQCEEKPTPWEGLSALLVRSQQQMAM